MADDWMPTTWGGKRAMFQAIRDKLSSVQTELGLTSAQVSEGNDLANEGMAVIDYFTQNHANANGLTEWRDTAFTSTAGGSLDAPPAFSTFSMPSNSINGMLPRLRQMRDQWVSADGYTQAIGELLMVATPGGGDLPEDQVTPLIAVSPAQMGYELGITISDRGKADMWIVETRQKGGDWQNAGSFTGKTANVTITPLTPGDPEQVDVRVRLRKNNQNYGNVSQTATVTVNP